MAVKKYWLYLERHDGVWEVVFGAYDKADCLSEQECSTHIRRKDQKVVGLPCKANGHAPSQATVDEFMRKLNHGE